MKKTITLAISVALVFCATIAYAHIENNFYGSEMLGATILYPSGGGTGTSSNPTIGQMLVGDGNGIYELRATSSLGIVDANALSLVDWYATTTDGLAEGTTNLYFTNARADARILATTSIPNITTLTGLTTVGTIGTGIWQSTDIGTAYGGTATSTWTTGGLVFYDGTSLSQDVAGIFFDETNNRLGLGTTSPTYKLSTAGTSYAIERCYADGTCQSTVNQLSSEVIFYFHDEDAVFGYELMLETGAHGVAEDTDSCIANSGVTSGYCDLGGYVTATGTINTVTWPAGTYHADIFADVSQAAGISKIEITFFSIATTGVETYRFQATSTELSVSPALLYDISSSQAEITTGDPSDKMLVKLRGWTDSAANKTITYYYEGSAHYSHIHTTFTNAVDLGSYTQTNIEETITADWTHTGLLTLGNSITTNATNTNLFTTDLYVTGLTILNTIDYTWPANEGASSTALGTNGSGQLQWMVIPSTTGFLSKTANDTTNFIITAQGLVATSSMDIPSGAAPTVDAEGEIAIDTTTDQYAYYGASKRIMHYEYVPPSLTIASTTSVGATTTISIGVAWKAQTWTDLACYTYPLAGGTSTIQFGDGTNWMEALVVGSHTVVQDDGSMTNNTFTAVEKRFFRWGTTDGAWDYLTCTPVITNTAD